MTRSKRTDRVRVARRSQDLNLSLGAPEPPKSASVSGSSHPPTIVVDDDDDDLRISSPRAFAQAKLSVNSSRQRRRTVAENRPTFEDLASAEDLLELRLGPSSLARSQAFLRGPVARADSSGVGVHRGDFMIDLTSPSQSHDADCVVINNFVQKKRKTAQAWKDQIPADVHVEPKLTCSICMDNMKEETSTICGHLFCRECILGAIAAQKKCPTCRQKLTNNQTHRIYISGSIKT